MCPKISTALCPQGRLQAPAQLRWPVHTGPFPFVSPKKKKGVGDIDDLKDYKATAFVSPFLRRHFNRQIPHPTACW